jgi:hypothetical protein
MQRLAIRGEEDKNDVKGDVNGARDNGRENK